VVPRNSERQPQSAGDVTGPNRTLYDVFGGNYRTNEVITAMGMDPKRAGVLTEMGTETTTWDTIKSTPALTGMWTGVDYMGAGRSPALVAAEGPRFDTRKLPFWGFSRATTCAIFATRWAYKKQRSALLSTGATQFTKHHGVSNEDYLYQPTPPYPGAARLL
jgi:hypothetical protein